MKRIIDPDDNFFEELTSINGLKAQVSGVCKMTVLFIYM